MAHPGMTPRRDGRAGSSIGCAFPSASRRRDRLFRMFYESDVRDVLGTIRVPTLVLSPWRRDGRRRRGVRAADPRRTAQTMPGTARDVMQEQSEAYLDAIERFARSSCARRRRELESVLATVLFTDIVGSTATTGGARRLELGGARPRASRRRPRLPRALSRPRARHRRRRILRRVRRPGARRSAARRRSSRRCGRSGSRCGRACTPASAARSTARSAASRSRSAPG